MKCNTKVAVKIFMTDVLKSFINTFVCVCVGVGLTAVGVGLTAICVKFPQVSFYTIIFLVLFLISLTLIFKVKKYVIDLCEKSIQ